MTSVNEKRFEKVCPIVKTVRGNEECSVCLEALCGSGKPVRKLRKCNHLFHEGCIKPWLLERSATCPLCRAEIRHIRPKRTETIRLIDMEMMLAFIRAQY